MEKDQQIKNQIDAFDKIDILAKKILPHTDDSKIIEKIKQIRVLCRYKIGAILEGENSSKKQ